MASWAKVKIYYDTLLGQKGAALTATTEASEDSRVDNVSGMTETTMWKAADLTDPHCITLDTGLGSVRSSADYIAIYGHNLGTASAEVTLQYSEDGVDYTDAFQAAAVRSDKAFLKEFTNPGAKRYWRLKITGHKVEPCISICAWGVATELDYASSSYDPNEEEAVAEVNLSYGGHVAGIHSRYTEKSMSLKFEDVDVRPSGYFADGAYRADGSITAKGSDTVTLYEKVRRWWDISGMRNFFVGWETSGKPAEVFLMRPEGKFRNPLKGGGCYRDISIKLKGRKE